MRIRSGRAALLNQPPHFFVCQFGIQFFNYFEQLAFHLPTIKKSPDTCRGLFNFSFLDGFADLSQQTPSLVAPFSTIAFFYFLPFENVND